MVRQVALLGVLVLGILAAPARGQAPLQWKFPDKFYIEFKTDYQQTIKVLGQELKESQDIALILAVTVQERKPDGSVVLDQKVEWVKAVKDDGTGKQEDPALRAMEGESVRITLDPKMNVVALAGADRIARKLGARKADERKLLQTIFDGFFRFWASESFVPVPEKPVKKGDVWRQDASMGFGPLGTMVLKKQLRYEGNESVGGKDLEKITATADFDYQVPKEKVPGLPFTIDKVAIKSGDYKATLHFDVKAGRLVASEVKMANDLSMTMTIEGQKIDAEGDRQQRIFVRILDRNPKPL